MRSPSTTKDDEERAILGNNRFIDLTNLGSGLFNQVIQIGGDRSAGRTRSTEIINKRKNDTFFNFISFKHSCLVTNKKGGRVL